MSTANIQSDMQLEQRPEPIEPWLVGIASHYFVTNDRITALRFVASPHAAPVRIYTDGSKSHTSSSFAAVCLNEFDEYVTTSKRSGYSTVRQSTNVNCGHPSGTRNNTNVNLGELHHIYGFTICIAVIPVGAGHQRKRPR